MLGYKARNGKDTLADAIVKYQNKLNIHKVHRISLAKSLKDELSNINNITLELNSLDEIQSFSIDGEKMALDDIEKYHVSKLVNMFKTLDDDNAPFISSDIIVKEQCLRYEFLDYDEPKYRANYPAMMTLAQWWGTDYRRKDNNNYWLVRAEDKIRELMSDDDTEHELFIITDCRFYNEYNHDFGLPTAFINVERYDKDGIRYVDPSRDPTHPSETGLDGIYFSNYIYNYEQPSIRLAEVKLFEDFFNLLRTRNFSIELLGK